MLEIEGASVVNGYIDEQGHLILVTRSGSAIDAGPITTFLATEEAPGGVELATPTEVQAGTDTTRAVTPFGLATVLSAIQGYRPLGSPTLYTSSGSFVKSNYPGMRAVRVRLVGGGGGGGGAPAADAGNHSAGGGGGGGGYAERFILAENLAATETITVGAGGSGGTNFGGVGGTSSFGTHVVATGGNGGNYFANTPLMIGAIGAAGGIGTSGSILFKGAPGNFGSGYGTLAHGGVGGASAMGGGAFGSYSGAGGASLTGASGGQYGGGGGGAAVNTAGSAALGGPGASGLVIVEVFL
jgi:hypothetical protein